MDSTHSLVDLVGTVFIVGAYAAAVAVYWAIFMDLLADADERIYWIAFLALSSMWCFNLSKGFAWDFSQFYIAARMPTHSLYNNAAFMDFGRTQLAPLGVGHYPGFLRPAAFVPLLKPLGWFSYWHAFWIWETVVFASYSLAVWLLITRFKLPKQLLPAFGLFFPALAAVPFGQDIDAYFLVLLLAVICLLRGRDTIAGILLGLCTYKYHLLLLVVFVLLVNRRWKAVRAFTVLAAALAALSVSLAPVREYINQLMMVPRQAIGFVPGGIRGELLQMNRENWYVPIALLGLTLCIYLICRLPLLQGLGVAIAGILLFQYYGTFYDCTLLAIPLAIAWQDAGPFTRKLLLALLVFPLAWYSGSFQVLAECFLMSYLAVWAWRHKNRYTSVPRPHSFISEPACAGN